MIQYCIFHIIIPIFCRKGRTIPFGKKFHQRNRSGAKQYNIVSSLWCTPGYRKIQLAAYTGRQTPTWAEMVKDKKGFGKDSAFGCPIFAGLPDAFKGDEKANPGLYSGLGRGRWYAYNPLKTGTEGPLKMAKAQRLRKRPARRRTRCRDLCLHLERRLSYAQG